MFGKKFLNDPSKVDLKKELEKRLANNHKIGITRASKGVISRVGVYEEIKNIKTPTLIIVGDQDTATIPAKSERMHSQIRNSQLIIIPGAGHTSTIEEPEAVNNVLIGFLEKNEI
jgi:pimeloyl-ACP methyl ester carboxylesterase